MGKRQAPAFVYHRKTEFYINLLFKWQPFDGACRADLSAERASVFTISDYWNEHRRPQSLGISSPKESFVPLRNGSTDAISISNRGV